MLWSRYRVLRGKIVVVGVNMMDVRTSGMGNKLGV